MFTNIQAAGDEGTDLVKETWAGHQQSLLQGHEWGKWPRGGSCCYVSIQPPLRSWTGLLCWEALTHRLGDMRLCWAHPDTVGYSCYSLPSGAGSAGGRHSLSPVSQWIPLGLQNCQWRKTQNEVKGVRGLHRRQQVTPVWVLQPAPNGKALRLVPER